MWRSSKFYGARIVSKRSGHCSWSVRDLGTNGFETAHSLAEDSYAQLPQEAKVVICGGGVMGAAVAYHLAVMGLGPQTVIVESCRQAC